MSCDICKYGTCTFEADTAKYLACQNHDEFVRSYVKGGLYCTGFIHKDAKEKENDTRREMDDVVCEAKLSD